MDYDDYGFINGKVDLIEAFFNSTTLELDEGAEAGERAVLYPSPGADAASRSSAVPELLPCQAAAPWIPLAASESGTTGTSVDCGAFPPQINPVVVDGAGEEDGVLTTVLSGRENFPNQSYIRSTISSGDRSRHYSSRSLEELLGRKRKKGRGDERLRGDEEGCRRGDERLGGDGVNVGRQSDSSAAPAEGGFYLAFKNRCNPKKHSGACEAADREAAARAKEMLYRAAAMRPVSQGAPPGAAERPKRRNVRISSDPQTVAARQRRERISERLRVLQRLVPGGGTMDTASMLDEAANYVKFLKSQVTALEAMAAVDGGSGYSSPSVPFLSFPNPNAFFPMRASTERS